METVASPSRWALMKWALLLGWVMLSLVGALDSTVLPKILGTKLALPLPHLYSGHVMFVRIPRTPTVHLYRGDNGSWRPLYELTDAHAWLYERARIEANLSFSPAILPAICRQYFARSGQVTEFMREEHRLSAGAPQAVTRIVFRCDERGLTPAGRR